MSLFKHTLIFEGNGHGWTETLYFFANTNDLNVAGANVAGLADKRAPLLGKEAQIKGERLALILNNVGAHVTRKTTVTKYFKPGNQNEPTEDSGTSLQVQFVTGDQGSKKLMFMGGVWRNIFPNGDSFNPAYGTWASAFNQWADFVKTQKLGWLGRVVDQQADITGYTFDPETGLTSYVLGGAGITPPNFTDPVRVGVEFPTTRSALDGIQLVVFDDATHCKTAKFKPSRPFLIKGKMKTYTYGLLHAGSGGTGQPTGTITGQNPVDRKRGRPLFVSRGRLANRVVW